MSNYKELFPKIQDCDDENYEVDESLTEDELTEMSDFLWDIGYYPKCLPEDESDDADDANEVRRRSGPGRRRMGSKRRANPRRRFQQLRRQ